MRPASQANHAYICLPCVLKCFRRSFSTTLRASNNLLHNSSSTTRPIFFDLSLQQRHEISPQSTDGIVTEGVIHQTKGGSKQGQNDIPGQHQGRRRLAAENTRQQHKTDESYTPDKVFEPKSDHEQKSMPQQANNIAVLLKKINAKKNGSLTKKPAKTSTVGALRSIPKRKHPAKEKSALGKLDKEHEGRPSSEVLHDLPQPSQVPQKKLGKEEQSQNVSIEAARRVQSSPPDKHPTVRNIAPIFRKKNTVSKAWRKTRSDSPITRTVMTDPGSQTPSLRTRELKVKGERKATAKDLRLARARQKQLSTSVNLPGRSLSTRKVQSNVRQKTASADVKKETASDTLTLANFQQDDVQTLVADDLSISPIPMEAGEVPRLCHDLSRVLFNPGIYQLQDPRSRVYNFDPYLQRIMPVSEFNFEALNEYITSSRDATLRALARERSKRYIGSSSSMIGALAHFHFLLSQWRKVNVKTMSRGFPDELESFTALQRGPSAVFLRYRDGVYAIDADKQYDSANVLMSLGKSMEKLFTLQVQDFERYRKSNKWDFSEGEQTAPEAYHYSELGDFLMRSQLDAYDPRLPGTGTFDLKTRAVVSIRMNTRNHEVGVGYEIKDRFGNFESYEREFFDMIRSAFLKYSLQVRMGRMDGIFVAFHNVERIFGFQYVSLPEMDLHLHGQTDTNLGDQEFKLSLMLLNGVLDRATARFPGQCLRLHFETRDATTPFMYIFAEPVDDAKIQSIQDSNKAQIAEYERRINGSEGPAPSDGEGEASLPPRQSDPAKALMPTTTLTDSVSEDPSQSSQAQSEDAQLTTISGEQQPLVPEGDVTADITEIDEGVISPGDATSSESATPSGEPDGPLLAMTMTIQNKVNGVRVQRPNTLGDTDSWSVDYTLTDITIEKRAWSLYKACQLRRFKAYGDTEEENAAANCYLDSLRELSRKGAAWRKQQDHLDNGRDVVELYENQRK